jgi:maltooligosyltrehalose synthase
VAPVRAGGAGDDVGDVKSADDVDGIGDGDEVGQSGSRQPQEAEVIAVLPRLVMGLGGEWADTEIDLPGAAGAARWRNELTGEELGAGACRLADLLARFPVALLSRAG